MMGAKFNDVEDIAECTVLVSIQLNRGFWGTNGTFKERDDMRKWVKKV